MTFVGKAREGGIKVVVGSHSWVPYQREVGWAYQHEMELLKTVWPVKHGSD